MAVSFCKPTFSPSNKSVQLICLCATQNRKLRHLQGISLRNLCLSRSSGQARGKPTDDESLPNTFATPTKRLAQLENHKLGHSRSSIELKSPPLYNGSAVKGKVSGSTQNSKPPISKLRRRSTLNWTNALPDVRQKRLEDATSRKMADTWFSLHCNESSEPFYVSEVVEKAMNMSFRFFDLHTYGPLVTRSDKLTIKYWVKTDNMEDYILLIEMRLHLTALQFIGKTVRNTTQAPKIREETNDLISWKALDIPCHRIVSFSI